MAMSAPTAADGAPAGVLCLGDIAAAPLAALLGRYGIALARIADGAPIAGSFWGAPEAGVSGRTVRARADTPVHSLLHELCHIICMPPARRAVLDRDAGGDDAEECAVCYLQILLADCLPDVGRARLMRDMDRWGCSFRLGSAARWFAADAADARTWLLDAGLLGHDGRPRFRLRGA